MIHTLTTSGALYRINRDRGAMTLARDKRRAFWLIVAFSFCVTAATMILRYGFIWMIHK